MPNPLLDNNGARETPLNDGAEAKPPAEPARQEERATPLNAPRVEPPAAKEVKPPADPAPEVKALRADIDGVKGYLQNLHTFLTSKFAAANDGKAPPKEAVDAAIKAVAEGELTAEELTEKPVEALNKFFEAKMAPIVSEYRQDRVVQNYNAAKAEKKDWAKYEPKIAEMMRQVSPDELSKPGAFDILYKLARADDIDNLIKEAYENGKKSVLEEDDRHVDVSVRPGVRVETESKRLSPVEKKIAAAFGLSDSEYIDNRTVEKAATR